MRFPFTDSSLHLRSWGEQIHLFRAAPVAQRLLQLQTVLRVSGWSGFPDVQRRHPVPRLRQGHLSEIHQKTTRAGLAACRHAQQHSPNFAWFESFISVLNINMFFLCMHWRYCVLCEWPAAFIPHQDFCILLRKHPYVEQEHVLLSSQECCNPNILCDSTCKSMWGCS